MPRPTKLTPALQETIVHAVQSGVPYTQAALLYGVSAATAQEWRRRGEGADERKATPLYATFAIALERAMAVDEAARLDRITKAARGGAVIFERTRTYQDGSVDREVRYTRPEWTADAWVLERSRPERWGRKERVDVRVNIQKAAEVVAAELGLTAEEVIAEAQRILKRVDEDDA